MQRAFEFGRADVVRWRTALIRVIGAASPAEGRTPLAQLIKSMLSGRTRDDVSLAAYQALIARYPDPRRLAEASPAAIEAVVEPVTFAGDKAVHLVGALTVIGSERPDFELEFLADLPLSDALAWLERLPGVGRKMSASTLNASTLRRPVFIVDTHILRVLQRLGFVGRAADIRAASEVVTAAMPDWSGDDFLIFHIVTKRLGQAICRWDEPDCGRCPLAGDCPTARRLRTSGSPRQERPSTAFDMPALATYALDQQELLDEPADGIDRRGLVFVGDEGEAELADV